MEHQTIVSREEWLTARREHLAKEKEFTHLRDELSAQRRALPWVKVDKEYFFEGPDGLETLADLFDGRSQLIIYHFMFGPDWHEGCKSCSFWADNFNDIIVHLNQRDITMLAASRAKPETLEAYKKRMGWGFKWVSAYNNDFNYDYHVSFSPDQIETGNLSYNFQPITQAGDELPGVSVFYKNEQGEVFHTYSAYSRGLDMLNTAYHYMDLVPKGRDEDELPWTMAWLRRHDEYASAA